MPEVHDCKRCGQLHFIRYGLKIICKFKPDDIRIIDRNVRRTCKSLCIIVCRACCTRCKLRETLVTGLLIFQPVCPIVFPPNGCNRIIHFNCDTVSIIGCSATTCDAPRAKRIDCWRRIRQHSNVFRELCCAPSAICNGCCNGDCTAICDDPRREGSVLVNHGLNDGFILCDCASLRAGSGDNDL